MNEENQNYRFRRAAAEPIYDVIGYVAIPAGKYIAKIIKSFLKEKSEIKILNFIWEITEGELINRKIKQEIWLSGGTQEQKAKNENMLNQIQCSCGIPVMDFLNELHNKPCLLNVGYIQDKFWTDKNGALTYKNTVWSVKPIDIHMVNTTEANKPKDDDIDDTIPF